MLFTVAVMSAGECFQEECGGGCGSIGSFDGGPGPELES